MWKIGKKGGKCGMKSKRGMEIKVCFPHRRERILPEGNWAVQHCSVTNSTTYMPHTHKLPDKVKSIEQNQQYCFSLTEHILLSNKHKSLHCVFTILVIMSVNNKSPFATFQKPQLSTLPSNAITTNSSICGQAMLSSALTLSHVSTEALEGYCYLLTPLRNHSGIK